MVAAAFCGARLEHGRRVVKVVRVRHVWEGIVEVEVPDDYEWDGSSLDAVWADECTNHGADVLVDYEVLPG